MLEHEARKMLEENQIPVLDYEFCETIDETLNAVKKMGYPVVLKVVSPHIIHKSEAGGVRLNLKTDKELTRAYSEMMHSIAKYSPDAEIWGVLVSPYLDGATELIVGSINDSQFGPVVMVGLGGIFVEIFKDVSFGIAPVDSREALEMLEDLKSYPIIKGIRGKKRLDIKAIRDLIVNVSNLVCSNPIEELDLNPVFCYSDKVLVGDARILMGA